jgi:hypothetical protein
VETVAELWVSAETGDVGRAAAEGTCGAEHVVDAHLTASWDAVVCQLVLQSQFPTVNGSSRARDLSGHKGGASDKSDREFHCVNGCLGGESLFGFC